MSTNRNRHSNMYWENDNWTLNSMQNTSCKLSVRNKAPKTMDSSNGSDSHLPIVFEVEDPVQVMLAVLASNSSDSESGESNGSDSDEKSLQSVSSQRSCRSQLPTDNDSLTKVVHKRRHVRDANLYSVSPTKSSKRQKIIRDWWSRTNRRMTFPHPPPHSRFTAVQLPSQREITTSTQYISNVTNTVTSTTVANAHKSLDKSTTVLKDTQIDIRIKSHVVYAKHTHNTVNWNELALSTHLTVNEVKLRWYHLCADLVDRAIVRTKAKISEHKQKPQKHHHTHNAPTIGSLPPHTSHAHTLPVTHMADTHNTHTNSVEKMWWRVMDAQVLLDTVLNEYNSALSTQHGKLKTNNAVDNVVDLTGDV